MPPDPTPIQKALAAVAAQQERQGCLAGLLGGFFGGTPPAPVGTPTVHLIATPGTITAPGPLILTLAAANVTRLRLLIDNVEQPEPQSAGQLVRQIAPGTTNKAYTYRLEGLNAAGAVLAFHETTVTVDLTPVVPPDPAAPTVTVSSITGGSVTLALGNLQSGDTLDWGDGVTVAAATSLTHTYSTSGTRTARVMRGGVAAASVVFTVTLPPPPSGLTNDGDAFTWTYAPFAGVGTVTGYRTYSMRSDDAIGRYIQDETPTPAAVVDNTVPDGVTVWYRTYAIVDGFEVLRASGSGTQPARTGWTSGQLVISAPGTYTIKIKNTDRTRAAVHVNAGVTGVVLTGLVASKGDGISLGAGSEVSFQNLRGWGLHPGVANASHGKMITGSRAGKITAEHCFSEGWLFTLYNDGQNAGVPTTDLQLFRLRYNRGRNCEGRRTTATGYVQTGDSRWTAAVAHFVQINGCAGILDAEIAWNEFVQEPGFGYVEDLINIYNSSCVAGNWGKIHHNMLYGGFAPNSISSRGYAGCGIIFDGVSSLVQFWEAYGNAATTSNAGIGVAHGYDIKVYDNDAFCAGVLEDGTLNYGTNVGFYGYDYVPSDPIKRVEIYGNRSGYYRPAGTNQNPTGVSSTNGNYYLPKHGVDGCVMDYAANAGLTMPGTQAGRIEAERALYRNWRAGVVTAGLTLGAA